MIKIIDGDIAFENKTIIVPSNKELYYKKKYVNKNYGFITLDNYLIRNYDGASSLASDYDSFIIMYNTLKEISSSLSHYKNFISFGFVNNLLSLYDKFYEYSLNSNSKINDINKIYNLYEEKLKANNLITKKMLKEYMLNNFDFKGEYVFLDLELPDNDTIKFINKIKENNNVFIKCNCNNNSYIQNKLNINPLKVEFKNDYYYKEFNDIEDEVNFVYNDILSKLNNGYNINNFIVVSKDIDNYKPYFDLLILSPYTKTYKTGVLTSRFISLFSNLIKGDFTSKNFINLLKLGVFDISDSNIDKIDNYVYSWDLEEENFYKEFKFNPNKNKKDFSKKDEADLKLINDLKESIINPIKYLLENTINETDKDMILRFLYTYLKEEKIIDVLYEKDYDGASNLIKALESISDYLKDETSITEIVNIMGNIEITTNKKDKSSSIIVSDLKGALYDDKKMVYFVGASEDEIQKSFNLPTLLSFSDVEKNDLISKINDFNNENDFLLSKLLLNKTVYITYHKLSTDLRLKTFSKKLESLNLKDATVNKLYDITLLKNNYAKRLSNDEINEVKNDSFKYVNVSKRHDLNKKITSKSATKLYNNEIKLSPSSIEEYAKCPFYYFCSHGLKLKVKEKYLFDSREVGTFVHYILENIIRNDLNEITFDNLDKYVFKYGNNYLKENNKIINEETNYVIDVLINSTVKVVKNIIKEQSSSYFKPLYTELRIDDDSIVKPLKIDLDNGKLSITGVIDRVDCYIKDDCYYRIIDYKTGEKKFRLDEVLIGLNLQMLIYLLAIKEEGKIDGKNVVPLGLLYYPALLKEKSESRFLTLEEKENSISKKLRMNGIVNKDHLDLYGKDSKNYFAIYSKDNINDEYLFDDESLKLIFDNVKTTLKEIGNRMLYGDVKIDPVGGTFDACKYCKFESICAFDDKNDRKRSVKKQTNKEVIKMLEGDNNAKLDN